MDILTKVFFYRIFFTKNCNRVELIAKSNYGRRYSTLLLLAQVVITVRFKLAKKICRLVNEVEYELGEIGSIKSYGPAAPTIVPRHVIGPFSQVLSSPFDLLHFEMHRYSARH